MRLTGSSLLHLLQGEAGEWRMFYFHLARPNYSFSFARTFSFAFHFDFPAGSQAAIPISFPWRNCLICSELFCVVLCTINSTDRHPDLGTGARFTWTLPLTPYTFLLTVRQTLVIVGVASIPVITILYSAFSYTINSTDRAINPGTWTTLSSLN